MILKINIKNKKIYGTSKFNACLHELSAMFHKYYAKHRIINNI